MDGSTGTASSYCTGALRGLESCRRPSAGPDYAESDAAAQWVSTRFRYVADRHGALTSAASDPVSLLKLTSETGTSSEDVTERLVGSATPRRGARVGWSRSVRF